MVNEYDKRQLELMLEKIRSYRFGNLLLLSLINDLGSIIDVLETVDESWKDKLRSWLWDLEEVYAVALDRKQQCLDSNDLIIIKTALNNIELLISEERDDPHH